MDDLWHDVPKLEFCELVELAERCCGVPELYGYLSGLAASESLSEAPTPKEGFSALAAPSDGLAEPEKLVRCDPKPRVTPSFSTSPRDDAIPKFGLRDPHEEKLEACEDPALKLGRGEPKLELSDVRESGVSLVSFRSVTKVKSVMLPMGSTAL